MSLVLRYSRLARPQQPTSSSKDIKLTGSVTFLRWGKPECVLEGRTAVVLLSAQLGPAA